MSEQPDQSRRTAEADAKITPPFGYSALHVLQRTDRVLMPHGATPEFCRSANAMPLSWGEFIAAARDYPIVFAAAAETRTYSPVAILGLADRQNLYTDDQGDWDRACYVPAFVRRYPFCMARLDLPAGAAAQRGDQRVVCIEKAYLDNQGIALYDDEGKPSAQWAGYERLLQQFEGDLELTSQMCAVLAKLELFSPFQFQVVQGEQAQFTLQGMHRIDEKRLAELKPASHKALVTKGLMSRIYAHIHSLENFGRLYSRALARAQHEAKKRRESIQR